MTRTVHRPAWLDYIAVKRFNDAGEVVGESTLPRSLHFNQLTPHQSTKFRKYVNVPPLL